MAVGFVVGGWVALCFFLAACRRVVQGFGQRSTGRVPGRCPFFVKIYCCSFQSFLAMVLLLATVFIFFLPDLLLAWLPAVVEDDRR